MIHPPTPMALWSKDHWGVLLYAEDCRVNHGGILDPKRLRLGQRGGYDYPTRLNNGTEIAHHDEVDILDDLFQAGLLFYNSGALTVSLRPYGWYVAHALRRHQGNGGKVTTFVPPTYESMPKEFLKEL
jgi:hypothetical protein